MLPVLRGEPGPVVHTPGVVTQGTVKPLGHTVLLRSVWNNKLVVNTHLVKPVLKRAIKELTSTIGAETFDAHTVLKLYHGIETANPFHCLGFLLEEVNPCIPGRLINEGENVAVMPKH